MAPTVATCLLISPGGLILLETLARAYDAPAVYDLIRCFDFQFESGYVFRAGRLGQCVTRDLYKAKFNP
jgi:hypothetical protein